MTAQITAECSSFAQMGIKSCTLQTWSLQIQFQKTEGKYHHGGMQLSGKIPCER